MVNSCNICGKKYDSNCSWGPCKINYLRKKTMKNQLNLSRHNWVNDIEQMHTKFGVNEKVREFDKEKLKTYLEFRINFLQEELDEMKNAMTADDVVDALIDLCVVAIGTLDAFDVNSQEAWERVHHCNMMKEVGVKASRPNPLGLPDLIKPEGWYAPTHVDNVGLLDKIYE